MERRKSYSLRWRIIALVSLPLILAGFAVGALAVTNSWHEIEEVYDAQLIHTAKVLRQIIEHELEEHQENDDSGRIELIPSTPDLGYKYERLVAFRVWHHGEPVTRSENALRFGGIEAPPGLSDQEVDGDRWRFFVNISPATGVTIETAQRYKIRYELVNYLLLGLLLPASLFVPMILGVVWHGTSRGLRPLDRLSREVDHRGSDDLHDIELGSTPRELEPVTSALNRLLKRVRETIERERDFTDNAAHELRTPLAAIKMQAQALRLRLADRADCAAGLDNLQDSIDRAGHLVDRLLSFARLQKTRPSAAPVELAALVEASVEELRPLAARRGQRLLLESDGRGRIRGDSEALDMMVRNLVDNAVKYSPAGGTIVVGVTGDMEGVHLSVTDNGPGIADRHKEKVLQRFYRIADGATTGSGLGLAIVQWVVEQHHALLRLEDAPGGGLRCRVSFPV